MTNGVYANLPPPAWCPPRPRLLRDGLAALEQGRRGRLVEGFIIPLVTGRRRRIPVRDVCVRRVRVVGAAVAVRVLHRCARRLLVVVLPHRALDNRLVAGLEDTRQALPVLDSALRGGEVSSHRAPGGRAPGLAKTIHRRCSDAMC